MTEFLLVSALFVLAMVALGLLRILRGASEADSLMAAQLLGTGGIAALLLLGAATGVSAVVDVALTLAAKEQSRLVEHLFSVLQRVDEDAERAFAILSVKIAAFLTDGLRVAEQDGAQITPEQLDRVANLQARNETLRLEHETLCQIARRRSELRDGEASALAETLVEGLGALLMWTHDSAMSGAADDLAMLRQLTASRSEVVDSLRRSLIHVEEQDQIYALTSLFERAVWLLQRYAQLLGSHMPEGATPAEAPALASTG